MFTGLIEEIGFVKAVTRKKELIVLEVLAEKILEKLSVGDSISVSGVCLTVTLIKKTSFFADVVPESLKKSSLKNIKIGVKVNLERAVKAEGRFGGHFVSGHVDGVGRIDKIIRRKESSEIFIEIPSDLSEFVVEKGSVSIDGVSLTIAEVENSVIKIAVIPETLKKTTLGNAKVADKVNIEADMLAKYVSGQIKYQNPEESKINESFLKKAGFYV